jgi:hypothetical protein
MTMNPKKPAPTTRERLAAEFTSPRPYLAFVLGYALALVSKLIFGS